MRILHTADIHVGNYRFGGPGKRLAVADRVLGRFVSVAGEEGVDLAIIAGDLFDTRRPTPREWALVIKWLSRLADICPVIVTDGNHDGAATITDNESRTLKPLTEARIPGVVAPTDGPTIQSIPGGHAVVTVPYPHKRLLDGQEEFAGLEPLARMEAIAQKMDDGIRALHAQAHSKHDGLIILAAHLTAAGATVGSERGMRLEDDITISTDVLDLFDYAALGHIHKQQKVGARAWYAGSPMNISWSEAGDDKSFLGVVIGDDGISSITPVSSGEGRLIDLSPSDALNEAEIPGAYIRVPYGEARGYWAPEALYAAGAEYVEVASPASEARPLQSERALDVEMGPVQALTSWLETNHPDLDHAPIIEAAKSVMETTE